MSAEHLVRAARSLSSRPLGAIALSLATVLFFIAVLGVAFLPSEARRLANGAHLAVVRCQFLNDADQAIVLTRSTNLELGAGYLRNVVLHDFTSAASPQTLISAELDPWHMDVSADNRWLFSAGMNDEVYVIDLHTRDRKTRRLGAHRCGTIWDIACTTDGAIVLSGGRGGLCAWEVATGRLLWQREDLRMSCWALAPCQRRLAVESCDAELLELELPTGRTLRTVRDYDEPHAGVEFSGAADRLAVLGLGGELDVVDFETGQSVWPVSDVPRVAYEVPSAMQFSPCGRLLATVTAKDLYGLTVWNAQSGQPLGELRGHAGPVNGTAFTPDGTLHSWGPDGTIRSWDCQALVGTRVVSLGTHVPARDPAQASAAASGAPTSVGARAFTLAKMPARAGVRRHE